VYSKAFILCISNYETLVYIYTEVIARNSIYIGLIKKTACSIPAPPILVIGWE
jgi:hypothetical protein